MHSNKFKKFIIILSITSFIFAFIFVFLLLSLTLHDGSLNIISNPLSGIKLCISAVCLHCTIMYLISLIYTPDHGEDKFHFQLYSFLKSVVLLLLGSIIFHIISVLYGAPVLNSVEETYHFSILMTSLVILPLCIFCGPVFEKWHSVFTSSSCPGYETVVCYTSILSIIGAWSGAAAIPLDWDRPWQAWPISCAVGAVVGYCVGLLQGAVQLLRELKSNKFKVF